jgi:hypothetical protein
VGNAWTGLDIVGHMLEHLLPEGQSYEPTEDAWLTDLSMVRMPFGTNMSLAHALRRGVGAAG